MSKKAEKLIRENLDTKHYYLNLGNCGLNGTEDDLYELFLEASHLTTLRFSNDKDEANNKPSAIIHKKRGDFFDCVNMGSFITVSQNADNEMHVERGKMNNFVQIPKYLPINLETLYISGSEKSGWKIKDITYLLELSQLKNLELESNEISDISVISQMPNLDYLNITNNPIAPYDLANLKTTCPHLTIMP